MKLVAVAALALVLTAVLPGTRNALTQGQPLIALGPCPAIHDPVCGRSRKRVLITYGNECLARVDRAMIVSKGACSEVCAMIFSPVCAIDEAGHRKTYGNTCQAKAAGARILGNRRCALTLRKQ